MILVSSQELLLILLVFLLALSLIAFALLYIMRDRKKDNRLARIEERLESMEKRLGK